MKKLLIRLTKRSVKRSMFISGWSLISAIVLLHFFYYGAVPNSRA